MTMRYLIYLPLDKAREIGSKTYFNGKPCIHGHEGLRYTSGQKCVDCAGEKHAKNQRMKKESGSDRDSKTAKRRDFSSLSTVQKAILVAVSLGDGTIRVQTKADSIAGRRKSAQVYIGHSLKHIDYLQWKLDILNSLFGGCATVRKGKVSSKNTSKIYPTCYATKSHPTLNQLYFMMYINGEKVISEEILNYLDERGIAIWYMDDGSCREYISTDGLVTSIAVSICTQCRTKEEALIIKKYFESRWNIAFSLDFNSRTTFWDVRTSCHDDAVRFLKLVEKYIVPCMNHKIKSYYLWRDKVVLEKKLTCSECGKPVVRFTNKKLRLCGNCYSKHWTENRALIDKTCTACLQTKSAKWFKGTICNSCYLKKIRARKAN